MRPGGHARLMIVTMRLSLRGTNPAEWLALRLGLVPVAAAEAWGGMALSGMLIAAVRTGMTARLADGPWTAEDLAAGLGSIRCRPGCCWSACGHRGTCGPVLAGMR